MTLIGMAQGAGPAPGPPFADLRYAEAGPVARVIFDRPGKRNALSMHMSNELVSALELVRRSESVKVLVISGAANTFCAGDDISEMRRWGDPLGKKQPRPWAVLRPGWSSSQSGHDRS
jgi:enoyl-CoA hydratase/carnithine racemase